MQDKATVVLIVATVAAVAAGVTALAQAAHPAPKQWRIVTLKVQGKSFSYGEPEIVGSPDRRTQMVVAASANSGAPPTLWISGDGGRQWSLGRDFDTTGSATGDADALVGPDGYRYALDLGYNPNPHKSPNTRVLLFRSRGNGPWSGPAAFPTHGLDQPDRPWLVVNPRRPADVDVIYAQGGSSIYMWRSTDHAAKFTGPIPVSGGRTGHPAVALSSRPLFDPTHRERMFMLYESTGSARIPIPHGAVYEVPLTQLWLASSTDAGRKWSRRLVLDSSKQSGKLKGAVIGHSLLASAVDRHGDLYAAFSARPRGATRTTVYLMHSTSDGRRWSAPAPIRSPTASNVMPALALSPHGTAYLSWYGSTSVDFRSSQAGWQEMFAQSTDPLDPHPRFQVSRVTHGQPIHVGGINAAGGFGADTGANWALRDFQGIIAGPCGAPRLVWADDHGVKETQTATPAGACR